MGTIAEVKTSFEIQLQAIFSLDQALSAERSLLKYDAFKAGRPLDPNEGKRIKEIAAARGELAEALRLLAFDTVYALENSIDVDKLIDSITLVNEQLKDDLDRLKKIADYAEKVEKFSNGMASVIRKLIDFKNVFD